jgi:6-phosphogluconolactonase (cycloisomerase 2 family)
MKKNINKTKKYLLGFVLTTSLGFAQYSLANDNNITINSSEHSKLALETAVADVNQRLSQINPNMRLSYVRKKDDNDGTIRVYKFTPIGISDGEWTAVNTEFSDNNTEKKTWDNDALL